MTNIFDIVRPLDDAFHLLDNTNKQFGARDCIPAACGLRRAAATRDIVALNMSIPFFLRGQSTDVSGRSGENGYRGCGAGDFRWRLPVVGQGEDPHDSPWRHGGFPAFDPAPPH